MVKKINIALAVLFSLAPLSGSAQDTFNYVIGTQTVGAKYKFTDKTNLVETAERILDMGSNLLKMSMSPRYWWENYDIPKDDSICSLKELAEEPSFKEVFSMPFTYYQIWTYEFSQYTQEPEGEKKDEYQVKFIGGLSEEERQKSYGEIYDLAAHLLKAYSGTGKKFYLGNWEGDWHLFWDYNVKKPADPATIQGIIDWFNIRQKAVDDAKKSVPHHDVELYYYVEVNNSFLALEGKPCLVNSVLPEVNPDYVSFSSYTATNPPATEQEMRTSVFRTLDYIDSRIKPKEGIRGKRLFIGEYGWPEKKYTPEEIDERAKWVMKAALEWGCPFILFWEMYNNEILPDGSHNGFWLIDEDNRKTPLYHTHAGFYKEAKSYVRKFGKKNGRVPSHEEFCKAALKFKSLK